MARRTDGVIVAGARWLLPQAASADAAWPLVAGGCDALGEGKGALPPELALLLTFLVLPTTGARSAKPQSAHERPADETIMNIQRCNDEHDWRRR